jgi:galactoside O-acetyltransferase
MTPEEVEAHPGIFEYAKIVRPESLTIGKEIEIGDFVFLNAGEGTHIGDYSCIHPGSRVVGGGELTMGVASVVTYNCVLVTSYPTHRSHMSTAVPVESKDIVSAPIDIGDEVFIGSNSVVMPDVTIGDGAVVGALSYVDQDVPPWSVIYPDGTIITREEFETYADED